MHSGLHISRPKREVHFTLLKSLSFDPSNLKLYPGFRWYIDAFKERVISALRNHLPGGLIWIVFFRFKVRKACLEVEIGFDNIAVDVEIQKTFNWVSFDPH